jgi:hypothetical protein
MSPFGEQKTGDQYLNHAVKLLHEAAEMSRNQSSIDGLLAVASAFADLKNIIEDEDQGNVGFVLEGGPNE